MTSPLSGTHTTGDTDHVAVHDALDKAVVVASATAYLSSTEVDLFSSATDVVLPFDATVDRAAFYATSDSSADDGNDIMIELFGTAPVVHLVSPGVYTIRIAVNISGLAVGDKVVVFDEFGDGIRSSEIAGAAGTVAILFNDIIIVTDGDAESYYMPAMTIETAKTTGVTSRYGEIIVAKILGTPLAGDPRPSNGGLSVACTSTVAGKIDFTITDTDTPPSGGTPAYNIGATPNVALDAGAFAVGNPITVLTGSVTGLTSGLVYAPYVYRAWKVAGQAGVSSECVFATPLTVA